MRKGVVSYGVSSYGYDIRVADEFKIFTNINNDADRPEGLRPAVVRRPEGRRLHRAAELVRAGAHGRVLPHPARRPHAVPGQVHLRPLRHHRQRDAVRAGVGGHGDARDLATRRRCRPRSTRTKASPRCCSSRATSPARSPTARRRASTSRSSRLRSLGSSSDIQDRPPGRPSRTCSATPATVRQGSCRGRPPMLRPWHGNATPLAKEARCLAFLAGSFSG